jgi:GNAT acetyltransferase-like protein
VKRIALAPRQRQTNGRPPVTVTSPAAAGAWEEIVASAPRALPSQAPAWLRSVCTVDGYDDATRLYEMGDGRRLVLPLVRRSRFGRLGSTLVSLPTGWGPAGLLSDSGVVTPADVQMIFADLANRAMRVTVRPDPAAAAIWDEGVPAGVLRQPLTSHSLSLDGGFDEVWRRFRSDTRTRVRRAQRTGVTVECDDTGKLVPIFQELYAKSVDRWARQEGQPLALARFRARRREPASKLRTVAAELGSRCRIYAAFLDGRAVAAIVVLYGTRTAAYWRGAMDEELAGKSYANYLLHSTAIEDAAAAGCTVYNMGDSAPGSPLALFKSRFGAVEQSYASYRIERFAVTSVTNRMRRLAGEVLKRRRGRP